MQDLQYQLNCAFETFKSFKDQLSCLRDRSFFARRLAFVLYGPTVSFSSQRWRMNLASESCSSEIVRGSLASSSNVSSNIASTTCALRRSTRRRLAPLRSALFEINLYHVGFEQVYPGQIGSLKVCCRGNIPSQARLVRLASHQIRFRKVRSSQYCLRQISVL